jgi:hypothetical protein
MNDTLSNLLGLSLPIIAQLSPDRGDAISWLVGLAAVAVAFNAITTAWGRLTGRFTENPLGPRAVTEEQCHQQHVEAKRESERNEKEQAERTEALRLEIKSDVRGIHSRVDDILRAVAEVQGAMRRMEQS